MSRELLVLLLEVLQVILLELVRFVIPYLLGIVLLAFALHLFSPIFILFILSSSIFAVAFPLILLLNLLLLWDLDIAYLIRLLLPLFWEEWLFTFFITGSARGRISLWQSY